MNGPGDIGDIVDGRFELLERLGRGGMGTVWRARDTALHREVALKEVLSSGPVAAGDAEATRVLRERVLREARALARISHPHVVTIHHIIDEEPHPWLVMELLPGRTLQHRLEEGPLPPREAARTGREILAALRAAHAAGIHHRDVKPANVLLRADGRAVLTDFGIAAVQGSASLTMTGEVIGSPEYMAPERVRGSADLPASDLWSLGMTLYVCVEGVSPMRRGSTLATLAAVLDDPVPPARQAGPLGPVLAELLVRDAAARPSADRLDALLAVAEAGHLPAPPPVPVPPSPTRTDTPRPGTPRPGAPTPHVLPTVGPGSASATVSAGPRRGRAPLAAAAAVVALALLGAGAYAALKPEPRSHTADKGNGGTSAITTSAPRKAPPSPSPPGPDAPATTSAPPSAPPAPATKTSPPRPPSVAGGWIAQLHSEPLTAGRTALERRLAAVRHQVPGAQVLRSDDLRSFRPGYWVIYAAGPFADGRAALSFCAEHGRTTPDQCVGRWVSDSPADRVYLCLPPAGAATGRCTRP
ncbi:nuclease PIN [Streptomyces agglomeratus]|uniref:serine/threonine-protein kinase n=1 Tax=Streptomyces agglomeratus TaxID=285458 RepID=UPI0008545FE0|nr:serine/threonine-protein kinase [Streptomyces agglomeratus]OEJ38642.1 nuclease PIN [Streptomyces agglomeratus]OEJ46974.1 nuclease PIN [Streptomyces agglomeratus]OEJ51167.1 nuclease PIN [Streptomyces agglomeratus]OEJ58537.1 nuclease PIN [Streptomyces agglomeratus]